MNAKEMIEAEIKRVSDNITELTKNAEECSNVFAAQSFYQGQILAKSNEQIFLSQLLTQMLFDDVMRVLGDEEPEPETARSIEQLCSDQADAAEHYRDEKWGEIGR